MCKNTFKAMFLALILSACATDEVVSGFVSNIDADAGSHADATVENKNEKPGCISLADCDDANVCTFDACEKGECIHVSMADNSPCDDGDLCTDNSCVGKLCTLHEKPKCDDDNNCTADVCDQGQCSHVPVEGVNGCVVCKEDADCGDFGYEHWCDGDIANTQKLAGCVEGLCKWYVGEGEVCKLGCNSGTGMCNECVDGGCDDGDVCTIDSCDVSGKCTYTPVLCDDNNACTDDACDPAVGCTVTDVNCDDGNACTFDYCTVQVGCGHVTDTVCVSCKANADCPEVTKNSNCLDSGEISTKVFTGKCVYKQCEWFSLVKSCDDNNPCTVDSCDLKVGCVHSPAPYGGPCDDDNACTMDFCDGKGACKGLGLGGGNPDGVKQTENDTFACLPCKADLDCEFKNKSFCGNESPGTKSGGGFYSMSSAAVYYSTGKCIKGTCEFIAKSCGDGDITTLDKCNTTVKSGEYLKKAGECTHEKYMDTSGSPDGTTMVEQWCHPDGVTMEYDYIKEWNGSYTVKSKYLKTCAKGCNYFGQDCN